MTCAEVDLLAAEAALALLDGEERAALLAHVEGCSRCAQLVEQLARTGDQLLLLAPLADPAAGFEQRVLERLERREPVVADRASRRWRAVIGVAAAIVLVAVAGFVAGRAGGGDGPIVEAAMRTASGTEIGSVYVGGDDEPYLFISVPEWAEFWPAAREDGYDVLLTLADSSTVELPGSPPSEDGSWAARLHVPADDIVAVAMVGANGRVWCSATLT